MTAALPAGLLERMINLTEALLAAFGDKSSDIPNTASAAAISSNNHGGKAAQLDDVSIECGINATSVVFKSLIPADIHNNHCSNSVVSLRRGSGGSSTSDGAEQNKIRSEEARNFESDTILIHRQVM
jgi:hypothetical protein